MPSRDAFRVLQALERMLNPQPASLVEEATPMGGESPTPRSLLDSYVRARQGAAYPWMRVRLSDSAAGRAILEAAADIRAEVLALAVEAETASGWHTVMHATSFADHESLKGIVVELTRRPQPLSEDQTMRLL